MALKKETYICSICRKEFKTKESAERCEHDHALCVCQKEKGITIARSIIGYGRAIEGVIDFQKKDIEVYLEDEDDAKRYMKRTDIRYCPFCGKKIGWRGPQEAEEGGAE